MKLVQTALLSAALIVGISMANSHTQAVDHQSDILMRQIPDASLTAFENSDSEIVYLRKLVERLRSEVVDHNDEIYNLRSQLRHAEADLEKIHNPSGNKYQLGLTHHKRP